MVYYNWWRKHTRVVMAGELIQTESDGRPASDDALFEHLDFQSPTVGPDQAALYVRGLTKTFGGKTNGVMAVKDVSFAIEPGEVIGLLGPNGAGKTTTIKSILGLILPDRGDVRIQGIDPYDRPKQAYKHVDAMFEGARNDYWRLTVMENLRYFASIRGRDPEALADRHERLLEQLDIDDRADTQVRNLSRGMKQKVSLASILASDVSIAFLDEPTLGLDVESSLKLRRELVRLSKERGMALLICSHDMDVIEATCDRVIILNDGRVMAKNSVERLLDNFTVRGYRITARNVDGETSRKLRNRFDLTSIERIDGRTRVEFAIDSDGFYRLTDLLEREDVELLSVETVQANLGDVILEMTGGGRS